MTLKKRRLIQTLFSLGILAAFLVGVSGLPHFGMAETMPMDGDRPMSDCYMPGMATICNMSPLEHISTWQNAFLAVPQEQNIFSLLLLLALAAIACGIGLVRQQYPPPKDGLAVLRRYRDRDSALPSTLLQELFSDGILNPKLF